nr:alpha-tectorin-like protein [Paracentrotus lividus]
MYPTSSIMTYDERQYFFPGECDYVATQTCDENAAESFQVYVKNIPSTDPVSYVPARREIRVELNGKSYELKGEKEFYLDGERISLPYIRPNVQVILAGNNFPVLKTDFGLRVWWDGRRTVRIEVPSHHQDQMCGLCGNFNNDATDDFIMRGGSVVASAPAFGFSWASNSPDCPTRCPFCTQDPSCTDQIAQLDASSVCSEMNTPFKTCLDAMPGNTYMSDCVAGRCALQDDDLFCEMLVNLAYQCEIMGVSVGRWRDAITRCAPTPPEGTMYEPCLVPCTPTCADPGAEEKCDLMTCVEGYACSPGLVFNGETCVQTRECGCLVEGKSYDVGESYLIHDCTEQCVCSEGGNMECMPVECHMDATCAVQDGGYTCHCNDGFSGRGLETCLAINQPIMTTQCENEDVTLTCESGLIDVLSVYYGQDGQLSECLSSGFLLGTCSAEGVLLPVQLQCQGRPSCTFTANMNMFGEPCNGVAKYIRVQHHCTQQPLASEVPQTPVRRNMPQGNTMVLECPDGTFLDIQRARYGRPDREESCFSATAEVRVAMTCQGLTRCEVDVTEDNLGETCEMTNNILEVNFECSAQPVDRTSILGHPCNFNPCMNGTCIATDTPAGYQCCCNDGYAGPLCDREEGECRVFGGSQIITFDDNHYQFHGDCLYTLFKDCSAKDNNRVPIEVSVRGQVYKFVRSISFIREVHIKLGTRVVILGRDNIHEVDDYDVEAPFSVSTGDAMLSVRQAGNTMVVTTSDGVIVEWNGKGQLSIKIPKGLHDTCGLCGDFDGNATNDFKNRQGQPLQGTQGMARAWAESTRDCTICNGCQDIEACTRRPMYRAQANTMCSIIKDENGPFADCFDAVNPEPYYDACMEDQCALLPKEDLKCAHYEAYADACQAKRIQLPQWRDSTGCSYMCPLGKVYQACSEGVTKHCGLTDLQVSCSKRCYEVCECPPGKVMSSRGICVVPEECGCLNEHGIDTYYAPAGSTFTTYGCDKQCTCNKGGETSCEAYSCHEHATCEAGNNGVYGCHCKGGYSGNGHTCHMEVMEYPRMHAVVTEGQVMNLDCGDYMLDILDVGYGSLDTVCEGGEEEDLACNSYSSYAMALGMCQGYGRCKIPACDRLFGDPCFTKRHYLSVYYTCSHNPVVKHPKMPLKKIICQDNPVMLNCRGGCFINVLSASYGRSTGRDICAADNIGDQSCHEPTSLGVVMSKCQGHAKCELWANGEYFPDPCPATFKYLEVEYECLETKLLYYNDF